MACSPFPDRVARSAPMQWRESCLETVKELPPQCPQCQIPEPVRSGAFMRIAFAAGTLSFALLVGGAVVAQTPPGGRQGGRGGGGGRGTPIQPGETCPAGATEI